MAQLGQIRQGPSFTMTVPRSKSPAQATQSQQLTSPYTGKYAGVEPGTISAQPFLDYAEQVETLALDPQNELRERERQRLQEQTRAQLAARGLNLSGAGAGIEGDVMADFGIDWQNQQLGRAMQGAQGLQILGGMGQNIAQAGFQNAMDLGASAFEYVPDVNEMGGYTPAPSISYTPGPSYGGGLPGMDLASYKMQRQARQTAAPVYSVPVPMRQAQPYRGGWSY